MYIVVADFAALVMSPPRYGQTEPPTIPVDELFEDGHFPEGEIMEHPRDFNTFRVRGVCFRPRLHSRYRAVRSASNGGGLVGLEWIPYSTPCRMSTAVVSHTHIMACHIISSLVV